MRRKYLQKTLEKSTTLVLTMVLITLAFSSVGNSVEEKTTTIYVDDDNTAGPWDGSLDYPYQCIQHGINAASPGDTVFVFSGRYNEQIVIEKTVSLIGENSETAIIDSEGFTGGYAVCVNANYVNISGFTIKNATFITAPPGDAPKFSAITILSKYNNIFNNIIMDNGFGIVLWRASDNIISRNIFINPSILDQGKACKFDPPEESNTTDHYIGNIAIMLVQSNATIITDNYIANFTTAIELGYSCYAYISKNILHDSGISIYGLVHHWNTHVIEENLINDTPLRYYSNTRDIRVPEDSAQVIIANCTNITVENIDFFHDIKYPIQFGFSTQCVISGNTISGISVGVFLHYSSNNTISENTMSDGSTPLYLRYSSNNTIAENTIINSSSHGIRLLFSSGNIIYKNSISHAKLHCIYLHRSDENIISKNIITHSSQEANIYLYRSSDNIISKNIIAHSSSGIYLHGSNTNQLINNIIRNNTAYGIYLRISNFNEITQNKIQDNARGIGRGIKLYYCISNRIYNNILRENRIGIRITAESKNNSIYHNNLVNNTQWGIIISAESDNNAIYHNNFIKNTVNARDLGSNYWDNGYPSGGNYWSDYESEDNFHGAEQNIPGHDGIGDNPYPISPIGSNQDNYPFMTKNGWINHPPNTPYTPQGPSHGIPNVLYRFVTTTADPEEHALYYRWDWGDGNQSDWMGPYSPHQKILVPYLWTHPGVYLVTVQAKDTRGAESDWSDPLRVIIRSLTLSPISMIQ